MNVFVGCDLGGTNIKAGLVDVDRGKVLVSDSIPTSSRKGPEAVLKRMSELILGMIIAGGFNKNDIGGVGISAPGLIDLDSNTTLFLPNLYGGWRGVPVGKIMFSYLGFEISMLNDVRAMTYGEWAFGAGHGVESMACFAIGTGVSGGLLLTINWFWVLMGLLVSSVTRLWISMALFVVVETTAVSRFMLLGQQ